MHVAATDETSPVAGRQQCIGGNGLVRRPNPVALHIKDGIELDADVNKLRAASQVRGEP